MKTIALLLTAAVLLGGGCTERDLTLDIRFERIDGLTAGSPVMFERNRIGRVDAVTYERRGVYRVTVRIDPNFRAAATDTARFYVVAQPGAHGPKAVELVRADEPGAPLAEGSQVTGGQRPPSRLDPLWSELARGGQQLEELLGEAERALEKARTSEEAKRFEDELGKLADELQRPEKSPLDKLTGDILPFVQRELERLRRQIEAPPTP